MNAIRCPICDKPMDGQGPKEWPEWPFCSKRCRVVDLGRWLSGTYSISTPAPMDDEDAVDSPSKSAAPSAAPDRDEA